MAASNETIVVAVELGTSRISGIAGKKKEGSFQIMAYAEEQTTACIKRGLVYNVEKTTQSIRNVIDKISQTLHQDVTRVYIGIGGQSVRSIRKKVPRNMLNQTSISAAHIQELQRESMDINIPDCELLENIVQGYVVDSLPVDDPQGVFGSNIEGEYLNIIARNQLRGNIRTCLNQVGVEIAGTRLSALELAKNVLTEQEKRAGCAMIDLGAGTTTVVVYRQNIVRYLVTIPLGFNNIVDDLKANLQIEEKEAQEVLLNFGNAYIDSEEDNSELINSSYTTSNDKKHKLITIHEIIEARLTEIVANAVAQIVNSGYSESMLAGIVITGGGANMKNIDKAFKNNPRKLKFEIIRVAKSIIQPVIKATSAASLNLENAMSGSLVSLLLSGDENCVGEDSYQGDTIFGKAEKDNQVKENISHTEEERKKLDEMIQRLNAYCERMREHINRLNRQKTAVLENPKNKVERSNALEYVNVAERVCDENFEQLIASLEMKLKNDQRIASAKALEEQLTNSIDALQEAVAEAKKNGGFMNRLRGMLDKIVNGEDE